ncbi:MAG TPA: hypothetical protein VKR21_00370 [Solirubrobacteraceae bacterium]|nr:hypothetical protein [Solirubrobacteraceae bacterium]
MTLQTIDTRAWHARYRALDHLAPADETARNAFEAIDTAFDAAADALKAHGFKWANDDRAEELAAALTRYLFESNREQLAHTALLIDARMEA